MDDWNENVLGGWPWATVRTSGKTSCESVSRAKVMAGHTRANQQTISRYDAAAHIRGLPCTDVTFFIDFFRYAGQ